MFELFHKEGKLFLYKNFLIMTGVMFLSGIAGAIILKIIMSLDMESTYINLGTLVSMYVAFILMIFYSTQVNLRFTLLVAFGQKRSNVIAYSILGSVITGILLSAITYIVYTLENIAYPYIYKNNILDLEFKMSAIMPYIIAIFVFVSVIIWFMMILGIKYGQKVFLIIYGVVFGGILVIPKLPFIDTIFKSIGIEKILKMILSISSARWIIFGVICSAIFIAIGYNILKKFDVRYF